MSEIEDYAVVRFPKKGKCKASPFVKGAHRVGLIPVLSLLDGGAPGDLCEGICLHCGRDFRGERKFVLKDQPRNL